MHKKKYLIGIRFGDVLVLFFVVLLAGLTSGVHLACAAPTAAAVLITTEDAEYVFPLSVDRQIPIASYGYSMTVVIENGTVRVAQTDCPSGICEATGQIAAARQCIVCLPARVLVKIVGEVEGHENAADIILP